MFKGGKLKFKKASSEGSASAAGTSASSSSTSKSSLAASKSVPREITELPEEGWIKVQEVEDLIGPIVIELCFEVAEEDVSDGSVTENSSASKRSYTLTVSSETKSIGIQPTPLQPSTSNVLLLTSLRDSGVYSIKSPQGRYLAADALGKVTCFKEAIGPSEEWGVVRVEEGSVTGDDASDSGDARDAIADSLDTQTQTQTPTPKTLQHALSLKNVGNQMHLTLDKKDLRLRCDSTSPTAITFKCQASRHKERKLTEFRKQMTLVTAAIESKEADDREEQLRKRIKSKHDPFC